MARPAAVDFVGHLKALGRRVGEQLHHHRHHVGMRVVLVVPQMTLYRGCRLGFARFCVLRRSTVSSTGSATAVLRLLLA